MRGERTSATTGQRGDLRGRAGRGLVSQITKPTSEVRQGSWPGAGRHLPSASKVSEKHSALVDNIGTYPEEDKAYELLNNLSMALPLLVVVTWVLDALLAAAYLKWLHPWKIILQEVSSHIFGF